MRILIRTDLEGVSGVCVWEQTRDRTSAMYQGARRLLMADIAAAVDGCLDGGATDVLVTDGHGGGWNIVPELMHPKARVLTGRSRPSREGMNDIYAELKCDAAILLGYHAMAGTEDGLLRHTQSSKSGNRYWYNGREAGEIMQCSLFVGHFGLPVIMVSGDDATCREARDVLGEDLMTVSVKTGYTAEFGLLMAPDAAHEAIRAGACKAVSMISARQPFTLPLPIHGRLQFPDKSVADAFRPHKSTRVDDYTFEASFERACDIYGF